MVTSGRIATAKRTSIATTGIDFLILRTTVELQVCIAAQLITHMGRCCAAKGGYACPRPRVGPTQPVDKMYHYAGSKMVRLTADMVIGC